MFHFKKYWFCVKKKKFLNQIVFPKIEINMWSKIKKKKKIKVSKYSQHQKAIKNRSNNTIVWKKKFFSRINKLLNKLFKWFENLFYLFTALKSYIKKYFCIHQMNRKFNLKKNKFEKLPKCISRIMLTKNMANTWFSNWHELTKIVCFH